MEKLLAIQTTNVGLNPFNFCKLFIFGLENSVPVWFSICVNGVDEVSIDKLFNVEMLYSDYLPENKGKFLPCQTWWTPLKFATKICNGIVSLCWLRISGSVSAATTAWKSVCRGTPSPSHRPRCLCWLRIRNFNSQAITATALAKTTTAKKRLSYCQTKARAIGKDMVIACFVRRRCRGLDRVKACASTES